MNIGTRQTRSWDGHTLIAGYRMIAEIMPALAQDVPTAEMDAAILSAARGNSLGRRARRVGYAAIAASAVAVGLTISTSRDSVGPREVQAGYQHNAQLWPHREARRNDTSLNGLVLGSYTTEAQPRAASEVHTASEIQIPGAVTPVGAQYGTVDLNQPEALQRLARENPFHFAMIRRILAGVDMMPEQAVGRWMKTQFNATDVTYSPVLLTSDPPKKQLAFTLETTHYSALLSLTPDGARLVALRR
jgi:hypothetical protein